MAKFIGNFTVVKMMGAELVMKHERQTPTFAMLLDDVAEGVKDLSPAFTLFSDYMLKEIEDTFKRQGPKEHWTALKPATRKDRERQGYNPSYPILVRTGRMKRNFTTRIEPRSFAIYNRMYYYRFHQWGTSKMVARPMLMIFEYHRRQLLKYIDSEVLKR